MQLVNLEILVTSPVTGLGFAKAKIGWSELWSSIDLQQGNPKIFCSELSLFLNGINLWTRAVVSSYPSGCRMRPHNSNISIAQNLAIFPFLAVVHTCKIWHVRVKNGPDLALQLDSATKWSH